MIGTLAQRVRRGAPIGIRAAGRVRTRRVRLVTVVVVVLALALLAWLWVRGSPLVAVKRVTVVGLNNGPDAKQIRTALVLAAKTMTTLDVHTDDLRGAVAQYPVVKGIQVSTHFPHGMTIRVIEQVPVGVVVVNGHRIAVAGDGTLLRDVTASASLPTIPVRVPPGGTRVTESAARDAVTVLAAAPYALLSRVTQITNTSSHGLVLQLRAGPSVYFGDSSQAAQKWQAVSGVLADPGSAGALYIDVTDPNRPAAGAGGTSASGAGATATTPGGTAATGTTTGTGGPTAIGTGGAAATGVGGAGATGAGGAGATSSAGTQSTPATTSSTP